MSIRKLNEHEEIEKSDQAKPKEHDLLTFLPFTEKYRPQTLDDVVGHHEIVKSLKHFVKTKSMPNLLFAGSPGIGKTTCAIALAKDLFKENFKGSFLELNASDERGIDVVRGKIKDFARMSSITNVPFKIIFLDEADALTTEAQQALRRTMEIYSSVTRFILSCNYSSKIIEPIQSRCTIFRFRSLKKEDILELVKKIKEKEGINIEENGLELLINISEGDLRKFLNVLQACSMHSKTVTRDLVEKVSGTVSLSGLERLVENINSGKYLESDELVQKYLIEYGLSAEDFIYQLYKYVIIAKIDEKKKMQFIETLGEFHYRITEGSNEQIQLKAMIAKLCLISLND
ncbi:MAG: replication factor C small subunit [Candidatus Micrarchaeota archaeon]|nr:replication factor C small subunit [Candidatus Micrarchaeota archaeon]